MREVITQLLGDYNLFDFFGLKGLKLSGKHAMIA
jgi:hypothetical protein